MAMYTAMRAHILLKDSKLAVVADNLDHLGTAWPRVLDKSIISKLFLMDERSVLIPNGVSAEFDFNEGVIGVWNSREQELDGNVLSFACALSSTETIEKFVAILPQIADAWIITTLYEENKTRLDDHLASGEDSIGAASFPVTAAQAVPPVRRVPPDLVKLYHYNAHMLREQVEKTYGLVKGVFLQ